MKIKFLALVALLFLSQFLAYQIQAQNISEAQMFDALGTNNKLFYCQVPSDNEVVWSIQPAITSGEKMLRVDWVNQEDSVQVYFTSGSSQTVFANHYKIDLPKEQVQTIVNTVYHCAVPEFDTFTNTYHASLTFLVENSSLLKPNDKYSLHPELWVSQMFDDGEVRVALKVGDPGKEIFAYWFPSNKSPQDKSILYGRINQKGELFWEKKVGDKIIRTVGEEWRKKLFYHWLEIIGLFKEADPVYCDTLDRAYIKMPVNVDVLALNVEKKCGSLKINGQLMPGVSTFKNDSTSYQVVAEFLENFSGKAVPDVTVKGWAGKYFSEMKDMLDGMGKPIKRDFYVYFLNPETKQGLAMIFYGDEGFVWGFFPFEE